MLYTLEKYNLTVINTHLDYQNKSLQIKQLKDVYNIIKKEAETSNIVLCGDFNMQMSKSTHFKAFRDDLANIRVSMLETDTYTWAEGSKSKKLDYIFCSDEIKVRKININKEIDISDHYPIIVKLTV